MMSYRQVWLSILLILVSTLPLDAQNRHAAQDAFGRGRERYLKGDFTGAIADLTRVIKMGLGPTPRDRQKRKISKAYSEGPFDDRVAFIDHLTARAYANRGLARLRVGDYDGATADCDHALELNPGLADAYNNRAIIHWLQKDFDDAIGDLDRALRINPRDAQAYNTRGNIKTESGDPGGAILDFDRAIQLAPNHAAFYCDRGQARLQIKDGAGALADFQHAIRIDPRGASSANCRAGSL